MNQLYHDGMAIVRKVGIRLPSTHCTEGGFSPHTFLCDPSLPSDLFLTFPINGKCSSIPLRTSPFRLLRRMIVLPLPTDIISPLSTLQRHFKGSVLLKADIFVTFTANANWPEVRAALAGKGQHPAERYDIISRVFKLKLLQMLADFKNGLLGPRAAEVMCVEWQKRGLPHAHILLFFTGEAKLRDAADYDTVVCAEIPPADTEEELHRRVMQTGFPMQHCCPICKAGNSFLCS